MTRPRRVLDIHLRTFQLKERRQFAPRRFFGVFGLGLLLTSTLAVAGPTPELEASEHEESSAASTPAPRIPTSEETQTVSTIPPQEGTALSGENTTEESERLSEEAPHLPAVSKVGADVSLGM